MVIPTTYQSGFHGELGDWEWYPDIGKYLQTGSVEWAAHENAFRLEQAENPFNVGAGITPTLLPLVDTTARNAQGFIDPLTGFNILSPEYDKAVVTGKIPKGPIETGVGIGAGAGLLTTGNGGKAMSLPTLYDVTNPTGNGGGAIQPGDPPPTSGVSAIPGLGTALTVAGALGISAGTIATVGAIAGAGYLALEAIGVQFPWETGPGEGFIAPWTPKTKDENGKWVSATTRPDLVGGDLGSIGGAKVVKSWKAGGWPFSMTSDGRIHTITKNGIQKSWKPKKPLVLVSGRNLRLGTAVRMQRSLDRTWRTVAKRTRVLKLAKG